VDVQCDKLAMVTGRTKLTIVMVDVPWPKKTKKSDKSTVWDKIPEGSTLISEITQIPY